MNCPGVRRSAPASSDTTSSATRTHTHLSRPDLHCTHESRVASSPFAPRRRSPARPSFRTITSYTRPKLASCGSSPVAATKFPRQNPVPSSKFDAMPLQYAWLFQILRQRTGHARLEPSGNAIEHGSGITASRPRNLDEVIDVGMPGMYRPRERANGVRMPASVRTGNPGKPR